MWRLTASLVGLATALGCAGSKPSLSSQQPAHWLRIVDEGDTKGPFSVVSASPQGRTDAKLPISVAFSHPLRPLGLAENVAPPPIHVEPPIAGAWQWVGSNAVTLVGPTALLVPATSYRVTVSGEARDLVGRTLGTPYVFEFETERPGLLGVTSRRNIEHRSGRGSFCAQLSRAGKPRQKWMAGSGKHRFEPDEPQLELTDHLIAQFNLPMDPSTLGSHITLSTAPLSEGVGEAIESVAFEASFPCPEIRNAIELVPKRPLPKGSFIRVTAASSMRAALGDLPAGESHTETLRTYGPLTAGVHFVPKSGCMGALLGFSNPVAPAAVQRSLSIRPRLRFSVNDAEFGGGICVNAKFDESKTYSLVFDERLNDTYGQPLAGSRQFELVFSTVEPAFGMGTVTGSHQVPQSLAVPMRAQWVNQLRAKTVALGPRDILRCYQQSQAPSDFEKFLEASPGKLQTFALGKRNWSGEVSLFEALGPGHWGSVGLLVQADGRTVGARLLHVTDLEVTAVLSPKQGLVWVTRRSSAAPVANATLVSHAGAADPVVLPQKTNTEGVAVLDEATVASLVARHPTTLLVAESGRDSSYVILRRVESVTGDPTITGTLFVDRGIYRPGDSIYVKGWVRRQTELGSEPLSNAKVELALKRRGRPTEDGDVALQQARVVSNGFGGFSTRWELPKCAPLDEYSVEATTGTSRFSAELRIGEYRRVEYSAEVAAESKQAIRGDQVGFRVRGTYLLGSPMKGAKLSYSVRPKPERVTIAEGFVTDAFGSGMSRHRETVSSEDVESNLPPGKRVAPRSPRLDARGSPRNQPLDNEGQAQPRVTALGFEDGPAELELAAEVSDSSQQVVAARAVIRVHPASFYLGMRTHAGSAQAGRPLTTEVIALSPDGRRLGGKSAQVELWSVSARGEDDTSAKLVGTCAVKTDADRPVSCAIPVKSAGPHSVLVTGQDERQRVMRAGERIWVSGTSSALLRASGGGEARLSLDREIYRPGEVVHARLEVPSPRAALLVSLETDRILWWKRLTAPARQLTLDIPIPSQVVQNATVVLYAVAPHERQHPSGDKLMGVEPPLLRTVTAEFRIDPELERLRVEVLPRTTSVAPGSKLPVRLKVTDAAGMGREAEVTLLAVDEGVLKLTGYRVHDPLPDLLGDRPHRVSFVDSQSSGEPFSFMQLGASGRIEAGVCGPSGSCGDAPSPLDASRQRFPGTAYFNPSIVTESDGTAAVQVPLGDAVSSYRLMAVAVSRRGQAGAGSSTVTTRQALMLRPALPRLLRVGDRVEAGVIVMNGSNRDARLTVTLTPKGIGQNRVRTQPALVPAGGSKYLTFPLDATVVGGAELRFDASGDNLRDSVTAKLPVAPALLLQTVASYGKLTAKALERLGDLSATRRDAGQLEIRLSATALLGVDRGLEQMMQEAWPSSEQVVSTLLPALLLSELEKAFGLLPKVTDFQLRERLHRLLGFQRADGGMALWESTAESHPWVSSYALLVLTRAAQRGLVTAPKAIASLQRFVTHLVDSEDEAIRLGSGPFAAYVLSQGAALAWDKLTKLWDARDRLPQFSKALLLEAIANQKLPETQARVRRNMMKALSDELVAVLHFDGPKLVLAGDTGAYRGFFDSGTRRVAMTLSALLAVDPHHPLADKLVRSVLEERKRGQWRSTQETSFVLLALEKYCRLREPVPPRFGAKLWLGERLLGAFRQEGAALHVQRFVVPMSALDAKGTSLRFVLEGKGTLHYETRLSYVPSAPPVAALDRGFLLSQRVGPISGDASNQASADGPTQSVFKLGEVVQGEIILTTPTPRDYVRLDVPVPAGLELLDTRLETTPAKGRAFGEGMDEEPVPPAKLARVREAAGPGGASPKPMGFSFSPQPGYASHHELRDDGVRYYVDHLEPGAYRFRYLMRATAAGRFLLPPSVAQELYAPEVMGRTGASQVTVR